MTDDGKEGHNKKIRRRNTGVSRLLRLGLVGAACCCHRSGFLVVPALLQLCPRAHRPLAVGHEPERREHVDEHLGGVELRAHAELGRGVIEGVLVVPGEKGGKARPQKKGEQQNGKEKRREMERKERGSFYVYTKYSLHKVSKNAQEKSKGRMYQRKRGGRFTYNIVYTK